MIQLTEKKIKAEQKDFEKLEKIIARKDKKALDRWTKKWLKQERKEERKFNKITKKEYEIY